MGFAFSLINHYFINYYLIIYNDIISLVIITRIFIIILVSLLEMSDITPPFLQSPTEGVSCSIDSVDFSLIVTALSPVHYCLSIGNCHVDYNAALMQSEGLEQYFHLHKETVQVYHQRLASFVEQEESETEYLEAMHRNLQDVVATMPAVMLKNYLGILRTIGDVLSLYRVQKRLEQRLHDDKTATEKMQRAFLSLRDAFTFGIKSWQMHTESVSRTSCQSELAALLDESQIIVDEFSFLHQQSNRKLEAIRYLQAVYFKESKQ